MLNIRQEKHLARHLDLDVSSLRALAASPESYCEELFLHDPAKPKKKPREVLAVYGSLRKAQQRIYKRILLPHLIPSDHNYGCVRGRDIKKNAARHLGSQFAFSCDITAFYPSVHYSRVYRFFTDQGCSPDVARLLTQLCTVGNHLALGLTTSPLLAGEILRPFDDRIANMAQSKGLTYTRYVDDIVISGSFDFRGSGFPRTIKRVLESYGFKANESKDQYGRIGDPEVLITKIRVNRGHLDISREYLDRLCTLLRDLRTLGQGGEFSGLYYTHGQVWGKIAFVSWINPGRRKQLRRLLRLIRWKTVRAEAEKRGLVVCKKTLRPKGRTTPVIHTSSVSVRKPEPSGVLPTAVLKDFVAA